MADLFTYGSLMDAEIMAAVSKHSGAGEPVILLNYQRVQVVNEHYPAIIGKPYSQVAGLLYRNISDVAMTKLDEFEGDEYLREQVTIKLANDEQQTAFAYVWRSELNAKLSEQDWSFEEFLAEGKAEFMAAYVGFKRL